MRNIISSRFAINSHNDTDITLGRSYGLGLELETYALPDVSDTLAAKQAQADALLVGFSQRSLHGTIVNRDLDTIRLLSAEDLLMLYNESYRYALHHDIHKIVFHSPFLSPQPLSDTVMNRSVRFLQAFLADKPSDLMVYIENFIYDTPALLARLCDAIADPRLAICLDTGHALCNSSIPLSVWIDDLGTRIQHVHLHNNDGVADRHWPLGKGIASMDAVIDRLLNHTSVEMLVLECDAADSVQWLIENGFAQ